MFLVLASFLPHILQSISATPLPNSTIASTPDTMARSSETICPLPFVAGVGKQYFRCPGPEDSSDAKFCCPDTICPLPAVEGVPKNYFLCPGPGDSKEDKFCCGDHKCCGPLRVVDGVLGVDIEVSMAVSLAVMALCAASIVIIVICCFSPSCPHYESCMGRDRPKDKGGERGRDRSNAKYHRADSQRNGNGHLAKEEIV